MAVYSKRERNIEPNILEPSTTKGSLSVGCTIETKEPADIFSSVMVDREGQTACDYSKIRVTRLTSPNLTHGEMPINADITNYHVYMEMDFGSWGPIIRSYLYDGTTIKEIIIRRLMNIKNTTLDIQVITYKNCLFSTYEQMEDSRIKFSFSWESTRDESILYTREGEKVGTSAMEFDSSTLTTKQESS